MLAKRALFVKDTRSEVGLKKTQAWEEFRRSLASTFPFLLIVVSNGNRTEWNPIRSVIIRVITKSDDRAVGVLFVYHEYDYRPNWTTQSPIAN